MFLFVCFVCFCFYGGRGPESKSAQGYESPNAALRPGWSLSQPWVVTRVIWPAWHHEQNTLLIPFLTLKLVLSMSFSSKQMTASYLLSLRPQTLYFSHAHGLHQQSLSLLPLKHPEYGHSSCLQVYLMDLSTTHLPSGACNSHLTASLLLPRPLQSILGIAARGHRIFALLGSDPPCLLPISLKVKNRVLALACKALDFLAPLTLLILSLTLSLAPLLQLTSHLASTMPSADLL